MKHVHLLIVSLFLSSFSFASGTYESSPPSNSTLNQNQSKSSVPRAKIDKTVYRLGKSLYKNVTKMEAGADDAVYQQNLKKLSLFTPRLPKRVQKKIDSELVARNLNSDELYAYYYYLKVRYRI